MHWGKCNECLLEKDLRYYRSVDLQRNFNIHFDFAIEKDCWISHEVMINHRSGSRDLFMLFQHFSLSVVFTAITLVNTCIYLHPYLQVLHCTPWLCCDLDKLFYEIRWIEHGKILPSYIMCIVVYGCMNIYKWVCAKFLHIFLPGCCHTTMLTYCLQ